MAEERRSRPEVSPWLRNAAPEELDAIDLGTPTAADGTPSARFAERQRETQVLHELLSNHRRAAATVASPSHTVWTFRGNPRADGQSSTRQQEPTDRFHRQQREAESLAEWGRIDGSDLPTHGPAYRRRTTRIPPTSQREEGRDAASLARRRESRERERNAAMLEYHWGWGMSHRHFGGTRNMGDYVRDSELDTSYEGLLNLAELLGEARPRGVSEEDIASLPSGVYVDWATPGETDERCPICLDDYQPVDPVLKVPACSHWFHRGCLEQWLKNARTCPVCRGRVAESQATTSQERQRVPPWTRRAASRALRTHAGSQPAAGRSEDLEIDTDMFFDSSDDEIELLMTSRATDDADARRD